MPETITPKLTAIRGATTLDADTEADMTKQVCQLLGTLAEKNQIQPTDVVNVIFSLTKDIHSCSPAKVAREAFGWETVPMFCTQEPDIQDYPGYCIRVLIQWYTSQRPEDIHHVYLGNTKTLRPDLS